MAFDIDANGIMHVSAKDLGTGKEQKMTVTGGSALPRDDIDRMVREAEQHAEEDRNRREAAETRNQAEQLVYLHREAAQGQRRQDPGGREVRDRDGADGAEGEAEVGGHGGDPAGPGPCRAGLAQKIGTALYERSRAEQAGQGGQAGQPGQPGRSGAGGTAASGSDDEVVDAEIVDDDKPEAG